MQIQYCKYKYIYTYLKLDWKYLVKFSQAAGEWHIHHHVSASSCSLARQKAPRNHCLLCRYIYRLLYRYMYCKYTVVYIYNVYIHIMYIYIL